VSRITGHKPGRDTEPATRSGKAEVALPAALHAGGIDAHPRDYERRVVTFFDDGLLHHNRSSEQSHRPPPASRTVRPRFPTFGLRDRSLGPPASVHWAGSGGSHSSAGRSARVCVTPRSSRPQDHVVSWGGRGTGCTLCVGARGRVAVAGDAAGRAARQLRGVDLVRAEWLSTVAVPWRGLGFHSPPWLNVRVEHDQLALLIRRDLLRRERSSPYRSRLPW
jgi:hypothetical protein